MAVCYCGRGALMEAALTRSRTVTPRQMDEWSASFQAGESLLTRLIGAQRTRYHRILRDALESWQAAAEQTATAARALRSRKPPALKRADARACLREAAFSVSEAAANMFEASCLAAGARVELGWSLGSSLPPEELREAVYLARAGSAPFRLLAAHILLPSEDPQARSTLDQLAFDSDRQVAETAVHAVRSEGRLAAVAREAPIPGVRAIAIYRLAETGAENLVSTLVETEDHPLPRAAAAAATRG